MNRKDQPVSECPDKKRVFAVFLKDTANTLPGIAATGDVPLILTALKGHIGRTLTASLPFFSILGRRTSEDTLQQPLT